MTTVFNMVKLDFFTLKSQFVVYLTVPAIIGMFCMMNSSILHLSVTAAWLILIVNTNLFAIQEKYGLERLYSSLAITKKIFILGRYLSTICNFVIAFVVSMVMSLSVYAFNGRIMKVYEVFSAFCLSLLVFSFVLAVQLPIYFRFGYSKGRYLSLLPFIAVFGIGILSSLVEKIDVILKYILAHDISFLCLAGSIMAMVISYFISLFCYK